MDYTPFVREELKEEADVFHNPGNAQHTGKGPKNVEALITANDYDIIQFNWGLWDLCYRHPASQEQGETEGKFGRAYLCVWRRRAILAWA
ncbi:hypothetical protein [Saccharicrinis fermentans]|uniref:hypothetical protein n=1 Tax=Saccharicrinis fermentans TaxID=982 RepID=UPI000487C661|nr:hypothetical protein [Saccharicrinis fermentans]